MSLTDVSTVTDSISIVLIDDHPIVRSGISTLMSLTNDLNVVGEAESVETAIELLGQVDPDIAVLDLRLPDGPGLDVARWIAENRRRTRCVVLTSVPTDRAIVAAYETGAVMAFLAKKPTSTRCSTASGRSHRGTRCSTPSRSATHRPASTSTGCTSSTPSVSGS